MLTRIWRWLTRRTGFQTAFALLLAVVAFQQLVFAPRTAAHQRRLAPNLLLFPSGGGGDPPAVDPGVLHDLNQPVLDGRMWYSAAEVGRLFRGLGPELDNYRASELTADLIFPWVAAALWAVLLGIGFRGAYSDRDAGRWWLLLPVGYFLADYGENLAIALVLIPAHRAGQPMGGWVVVAAVFTAAKWLLCLGTLLAFLWGADRTARRAVRDSLPGQT